MLAFGLLLGISCTAQGGKDVAIETPAFKPLGKMGALELRQYEPHIVASVRVSGERKDSLYKGFRVLADYIFGRNQSGAQVAMTAPVSQQPEGDSYRVTFMMPSKYSLDTLPVPSNSQVRLEPVPGRKVAVLSFSGWDSDGNVERHRQELLKEIKALGLETVGAPLLAQYDPPWKFPFFRTNEWWVEIR